MHTFLVYLIAILLQHVWAKLNDTTHRFVARKAPTNMKETARGNTGCIFGKQGATCHDLQQSRHFIQKRVRLWLHFLHQICVPQGFGLPTEAQGSLKPL